MQMNLLSVQYVIIINNYFSENWKKSYESADVSAFYSIDIAVSDKNSSQGKLLFVFPWQILHWYSAEGWKPSIIKFKMCSVQLHLFLCHKHLRSTEIYQYLKLVTVVFLMTGISEASGLFESEWPHHRAGCSGCYPGYPCNTIISIIKCFQNL